MPTATPFTALGKGNGFPFCATKQDVSSYYKWVTLGGTQKGNAPTVAEKNASLINAMKLFWNAYELLGLASSTNVSSPLPNIIFTEQSSTNPEEPENRVCPRQSSSFYSNSYSVTEGSSSVFGVIDIYIIRMYDGSTNDENNFVGYGMSTTCSIGADTVKTGFLAFAQVEVSVGSFLPFDPSSSNSNFNPKTQTDVDYVTFAGFPLVATAYGSAFGNTTETVSVSASSLTASASYVETYGSPPNQTTDSGTSTASLTNIDFYTY